MRNSAKTTKRGSKRSRKLKPSSVLAYRCKGAMLREALAGGKLERCEEQCTRVAVVAYNDVILNGGTEQEAQAAAHDAYVGCMRECMA